MICGRISEKKKAALQSLGCKMPTGYIFYGPPGNGKTLLARAIACEANAKFISVSGSECMQKYVGQSAHYIKDLFKKARKNAPCIVFIDEIDAVCTKRSDGDTGGEMEHNRIVNQFLAELNGFHSTEGVTVIAATNRLESLDEAVVRSGRLSKHIEIPLPEKEQRKKILNLYLKKDVDMKRVTMPENAEALAEKTNGFSGVDLEELVNEAKIHAVDRMSSKELEKGNIKITMDDFNSAFSDLKKKKPQKSENGQVSSNKISNCTICNPVMQGFHLSHAYGAR